MHPVHGQELFSFSPLSAQMCIEIGDNDRCCAREAEIMSTALQLDSGDSAAGSGMSVL